MEDTDQCLETVDIFVPSEPTTMTLLASKEVAQLVTLLMNKIEDAQNKLLILDVLFPTTFKEQDAFSIATQDSTLMRFLVSANHALPTVMLAQVLLNAPLAMRDSLN